MRQVNRYHKLSRIVCPVGVAPITLGLGSLVLGQAPETPSTPPAPLPAGILNPATTTNPVQPASSRSGTQTLSAKEQWKARLPQASPEAAFAFHSMEPAADWLYARHQAGGQFLLGINPTSRQWIEAEQDLVAQCQILRGYLAACRFLGDERHKARATSTVLTLLSFTRPGPDGQVVPNLPADRGSPVEFAAWLLLGIQDCPGLGPEPSRQAEGLSLYLLSRLSDRGDVALPTPQELHLLDPVGRQGLVMLALVQQVRRSANGTLRERVPVGMQTLVQKLQESPASPGLPYAVLALAEYALLTQATPTASPFVLTAADRLQSQQATKPDPRHALSLGGFVPPGRSEARIDTALAVVAWCRSAQLCRQVPDLVRYQQYRHAATQGMVFLRALQVNADQLDHFEPGFRQKYLVGGVRPGPNEAALRSDATGLYLWACEQFLSIATDRD